jgi:hypothetical protein
MFEININKNHTIEAFNQLVENSFKKKDYLPDTFNKQQQEAIELFQKRIFLEKTIEETIAFNKNLNFPNENKHLYLATTAEDLIEVFKLRSEVYTQINYQSQFPDTIEGLNFDSYDTHSAILFCKTNNKISGTAKLIFALEKELLPSEKNFPLQDVRKKYTHVGELARLIISQEKKGLTLEFKYLFEGLYHLFMNNSIDIIISCIKKEHTKLYSKFGGGKIIDGTDSFGNLDVPIHILAWNPSKTLPFFKKAFLNQK